MNKIILSVLFFITTFFSGLAQSKQGTVTSLSTKQPIANVVIKTEGVKTVTNSQGIFTIDLPIGTHVITLKAEGYKTITKKINCDSNSCMLDFFMKEDFQELKTVFIHNNKREKNILRTSASVSEISSSSIKETQTEQLEDLNSLIPNYVYSDLGVSYQQQISLRGVSAFSEVPSISTYIDGINTFNISGNNLLLSDIEKISVYRGPQGALFGQDAVGGVINIVTKKPTNRQTAFIEASIGNQGLYSATYGFKVPLIENKLFLGISGKFKHLDGYYENNLNDLVSFQGEPLDDLPENGERIGDYQTIYSDFYLRYKPNKKLDIILNVKKQLDESVGASPFYQAILTPEEALENPDEFSVNSLGNDQRDVFNASLAIKYNFGNYTLNTTSYYSKVEVGYDNIDGDLTQFDFYTASSSYKGILGNPYPKEVIGQEIRITSDEDKKLTWLAGGAIYFQNYKTQYSYIANFISQEYKDFQENTGISGFGKVSYEFSEKLNTSLDVRYDTEIKNINASLSETETGNPAEIIESIDRKRVFNSLAPKLVFNYTPTTNNQLYISYARGFKAGGINNRVVSANNFSTYDSEFSNVVELGYKWISDNGKYFVSATGYGMYWQDLQLYYFSQETDVRGVWVIDNIGDVRSYGAEMEISARPFSGFKANLALGTNYAKYEGFEFLGTDIKDNKVILSPEFTSFLGMQQSFSIHNKKQITGTIRGEWRVVGDQYFDLVNTIKQDTYQLFNAQFTVKRKRLSLIFGIKNIFNKRYISFSMPGQFKATILNRPRVFKTSLAYGF